MTTQTIGMWAIATAGAIFALLWTLGYLVMVGVVISAWSSGRLPWRRVLWSIVIMIAIWPIVLGGALAKVRRPGPKPPRAGPTPPNAKGPA